MISLFIPREVEEHKITIEHHVIGHVGVQQLRAGFVSCKDIEQLIHRVSPRGELVFNLSKTSKYMTSHWYGRAINGHL